ncbi:MAG: OmpA family protein [Pseudomonadota bacterium]
MRIPFFSALAVVASGTFAAAQPAESLFDMVFPGAKIVDEAAIAYDETLFITGPMESAFVAGDLMTVEGEARMAAYEMPEGRSVLEAYRAYEKAIAGLGFEPIHSCTKEKECGGRIHYIIATEGRSNRFPNGHDFRYGVFERTVNGAREVVHVMASGKREKTGIYLELAKTDAVETGLEMLSASEIGAALDADGTAAIYGLEFAFDSAELLPASQPVLAEMAGFLTERPEAPILLVGHTDNQGALPYNVDLSTRRAQAVRQALIGQFGIAPGRLEAHGVGFLAPRAPNGSEDGRARNRRVEMMLR